VEIDLNDRRAVVARAAPLADGGAAARAELQAAFPQLAACEIVTEPALLGGLRVQVGSRVWDSSISGRLAELEKQF
jgi:F-type H+-transporting ATPase subunit delta